MEANNKIHDLHLQPKKLRTIKEIVIPNNHDEQLRSVNDQLKKIPSPWYNKENSTTPKVSKLSNQYMNGANRKIS